MVKGRFPDLFISRRKFLGLGAGALAAVGLGSSAHSTPFGSYFYEPEVRSSANGFLSTTLHAAPGAAVFKGEAINTWVYEGTFPGPTLRIRPGDFLRIEFINDLPERTNLHVHGLHVSPMPPSDFVLMDIFPGQRFTYEYTIPRDHPGGTYFYHPHRHGLATNQTFKGMSGMIVIEGDIDQIPGIAGLPERSLVIQRVIVKNGQVPTLHPEGLHPDKGETAGEVLVNGASTPIMFIRPGETQRWRLCNASVSSFWTINIEGHPMTLIAQDGNTLAKAVTVPSVDIHAGQRRDVLIQGDRPGVYKVQYEDLQNPNTRPRPLPGRVDLAYLVVTGPDMDPQPLPTTLLPFVDLRTLPLSTPPREITFRKIKETDPDTFEGQGFTIDNKQFDPRRVDQWVRLGATEEWTVYNDDTAPLLHPFHIHINPYQVIKRNGVSVDALSYEDTTPVPPKTVQEDGTEVKGSITFRTRFLDFPGRFVYHCHILGHEDGGMMGLIDVS